ncbi:hypothetical protein EK0264_12005 [Epidermidibacterium keratini]|uniref:Uncharacterized protein n=1 Tax=Epidermidibacterium keratini TaxID=1891644 RepID=A0A7L4YQW0_9ACTN|nr:hypothetical protein [Epidermidibacterium keratini]QHC00937.1 hypothetical protein EK0264_12005 [Epidermidibacterium keratini]
MDTFALQLDLGAIQTIGLIALGVLLLLAILFAVIIKKIVGKIIAVVILVGLAVAIYSQRGNLQSCEPGTTCTFFGVDVDVPDPNPDLS